MFQYYEITLQGKDPLTLKYKLEQHRPAQVWAGLINECTVGQLRKTLDPWQSFDENLLRNKVERIEVLAQQLNSWLPAQDRIQGIWNYNDHQSSVNLFHVHFPEHEKNETDPLRRAQLSEYNDLIHDIESISSLSKANTSKPFILICPDGCGTSPLYDEDYKFFRARRTFGELVLHYCHVGRHPFELFVAGDLNCPLEQIVPQYEISAFHTLRFYNDAFYDHWLKSNFKLFYDKSTLKHKIKFDDPKMAFGYIPIGNLISCNGKPINTSEVLTLVKNCNQILNWNIS